MTEVYGLVVIPVICVISDFLSLIPTIHELNMVQAPLPLFYKVLR